MIKKAKEQGLKRTDSFVEVRDGGGDVGGDQHRLRVFPSLVSGDISISSFNEIVAINEEGHHFIDINRLIYQPRSKEKTFGRQTEKLSWYLPDFTFIICNLLSVGISTYFILVGASTLQWTTGISMFSVPNCKELLNRGNGSEPGELLNHRSDIFRKLDNFYYLPCKTLMTTYSNEYDYTGSLTFLILRTKIWKADAFGTMLMTLASCNIINVFIGISACMRGYRPILIAHIVSDVIVVIGKLSVTIGAAVSLYCHNKDLEIVRILLRHFIRWYGTTSHPPEMQTDKEKEVSIQLDSLQIGLGCCGVDSWADYLPAGFPLWDRPLENVDLNGGEAVIPFSCCQRWWIRNIYCSAGAHLLGHPSITEEQAFHFHERIVQDGCIYKLEQLCSNLKDMLGIYGIVGACIHLVLIMLEAIAASTLIKNINKLIQDQKRAIKRKELMHEPGESGSELDISLTSKSGIKDLSNPWSKIAPPTEDETSVIKQRSNFNKFIAAMKYGKVGRWMHDAREAVTEGHTEVRHSIPQTAEEKKAREKELLHGKGKKEGHDEGHHHGHGHGQHGKRIRAPGAVSTHPHVGRQDKKPTEGQGQGADGEKATTDDKRSSMVGKDKEKLNNLSNPVGASLISQTSQKSKMPEKSETELEGAESSSPHRRKKKRKGNKKKNNITTQSSKSQLTKADETDGKSSHHNRSGNETEGETAPKKKRRRRRRKKVKLGDRPNWWNFF